MLHIVRKKGETITIDGGISIEIVDISSHQVRIGVQAPRHIGVYRKELYDRIQEENALALASAGTMDLTKLPEKKS